MMGNRKAASQIGLLLGILLVGIGAYFVYAVFGPPLTILWQVEFVVVAMLAFVGAAFAFWRL